MSDAASGLRARAMLQSPTRIDDDLGGATLGWADEGEVWARIEARGGGLGAGLDGEVSRTLWRAELRAPSLVAAGWRLLWEGRGLRVLTVLPAAPGFVAIECEEDAP
ncbi:MAG: hypothetical protein GC206_06190 [Alphaproteobacteria bacterium]|nr:hypothetical protein [Alphaproteobacteria bacterium]